MREGIYRLYRNYVNDQGRSQRRMVARFLLYGNNFVGLEDHDDVLESIAPHGRVSAETLTRLNAMQQSPYWELVNEQDVQSGEHEDLLPEVNDAGPGAWPVPKG